MRTFCFSFVLLACLACATAGCGVAFPTYRHSVDYVVLIPTSTLPRCSEEHPTGCSIDGHDDTPVEASENAPDPDPGQLAPYHPPPTLRPFDLELARSVLGRVDMTSCRAQGLDRGYLHARVTFAPSGSVESAHVDAIPGELRQLSDEARTCVSNVLASVSIPRFSGQAGSVTTEWFLP